MKLFHFVLIILANAIDQMLTCAAVNKGRKLITPQAPKNRNRVMLMLMALYRHIYVYAGLCNLANG